jgi:hypothetical protein
MSLPIHQAGDTLSIQGKITIRVSCHTMYTGMPLLRWQRKRSNPKVNLARQATVVVYILKVRDSSMWLLRYLMLWLGGIVLQLMV